MRSFLAIVLLVCCLAEVSGQVASSLSGSAATEQVGSRAEAPPASQAADSASAADKASRPVIELEHLKVLELSEQEGIDWRRDWWKYLLMALVTMLCLLLLVHITNIILRVIGVFICIGGGILGAILLSPLLSGWLPEFIPAKLAELVSPEVICLLLGALCGYAIAALVLAILRKPARKEQKKHA
jgi:MFS family permease